MSRLSRWWPVVLLALVPILPLWRVVVFGETVGPFDQIRHMQPWNGPKPTQAWDVLQADGVLQFYSWRDLVFESWGRGKMPLWNNYELCGTPLMQNSQSGAFYPPHILLGMLHVPTPTALALLAWFHLFCAGLGVFSLARRLGAGRIGAVVGGLSFSLSAFMLAWSALPSVPSTVAWIPWVLFGVWGLAGIGGGERRARRLSRAASGLAVSVAMMLLAGHLQFAAFGLMAAAVVAVWQCVGGMFRRKGVVADDEGASTGRTNQTDGTDQTGRPSIHPLGALGLTLSAVVLGAMLAAPQLLPVLQYSKFSHRANTPSEQGYEAYAGSALQPFELTGLVFPGLLGDPTGFIPNIESNPPLSAYWPQYVKQGSNYAETAVSLGPVVVMLLFFLRRRSWKRLAPLAAVGLLGLLVACGTPLTKLLYFGVPGWSATGSPGRAAMLFVLAACVAAALAPAQSGEPATNRRYMPLLGFGLLAALSFPALRACGSQTPFYRQMQEAWPSLVQLATRHGVFLSLSAALVTVAVGFAWKGFPVKGRPTLILAAVVCPVILTFQVVRTGKPEFDRPLDSFEREAFVNDSWDIALAPQALMPPNTASPQRIHEAGGYDSLLHRDTVAMLREIDGQDPAPPANGNMMFVKSTADPRKLADAGVSDVWSLKPLPQFGNPAAALNGIYRYYLVGCPGRVSTPGRDAAIVEESSDSLTIHAKGPGKLTVRDRFMPGWTATVDGVPTPIEGTLWRKVELPAGEHTVEFLYRPPGLLAGAGAAGFSLAVLVFGSLATALAQRR